MQNIMLNTFSSELKTSLSCPFSFSFLFWGDGGLRSCLSLPCSASLLFLVVTLSLWDSLVIVHLSSFFLSLSILFYLLSLASGAWLSTNAVFLFFSRVNHPLSYLSPFLSSCVFLRLRISPAMPSLFWSWFPLVCHSPFCVSRCPLPDWVSIRDFEGRRGKMRKEKGRRRRRGNEKGGGEEREREGKGEGEARKKGVNE